VPHDPSVIGKPQSGKCAGCYAELEADEIVRWDARAWAAWCWPCFKRIYLPNLARLQEQDK